MQRNSSGQGPGASRALHRLSGDYRNRSYGRANEDAGAGAAHTSGHFPNGKPRSNGMMSGSNQFDLARSPPGAANKNTKHVPCKFFKQGACQAGQACPFLHSNDATVETAPCKYFAKGNCKFGAKCALAHILPDGRRVNRPHGPASMNMNGGALNIGGRVNPPTYHQDSVLANSLLTQQQYPPQDSMGGGYPYSQDDVYYAQDYQGRYAPAIVEPALGSNAGSNYGSPGNESHSAISGVERRLTALDAPLPASFDSNGISHIARYGAVAASVPSKFGMESPPASLNHRTMAQPVDAVKALRSTVTPSNLRNSSQIGPSLPAINAEDTSGQRKMHSQQNLQRPHLLSTSVPRPITSDDWDDGFPLEEDFLPPNLHDDVLTPQEKMRRLSRPEQDFGGFRGSTQTGSGGGGGLGIPSGNSSKVGSPLGSSPSRFSALFAKQRQESGANTASGSGAGAGAGAGGLGHVGSPLRESHIQLVGGSPFGDGIAARPSPSSRSRSGQAGTDQTTPLTPSLLPRDGPNIGMSIISSQLQRTHVTTPRNSDHSDVQHASSRLQPPGALSSPNLRNFSAPVGHATGGNSGGVFDRTISSPRMNSTRLAQEREGEGDLVFSMDDDTSKRGSGIFAASRSPVMAPLNESLDEPAVESRNGPGLAKRVVGNGIQAIATPLPASNPSMDGSGSKNLYSGGRPGL